MMTRVAHLAELSEKHRMLDSKIREELARPSADETQIGRWKREKLKLKDEMEKLQRRNGQLRH
jgi:hypothetical protein